MEEVVIMSKNDIERLKVLLLVSEKKLSRRAAAIRLNITDRHFRRILKEYNTKGEKGIISNVRGRCAGTVPARFDKYGNLIGRTKG